MLGQLPGDIWTDINVVNARAKERVNYPTQKPLALLERIIKASSDEGDMVLDPFCGCATALVAAEKLGRKWVGIDISPKAEDLIRLRMRKDLGLFSFKAIYRDDIPSRTDVGKLPSYKTHKHHLYGVQGGDCAGCRHHFRFENLTVDHIVPRSKGGDRPSGQSSVTLRPLQQREGNALTGRVDSGAHAGGDSVDMERWWESTCELLSTGTVDAPTWGWVLIAIAVAVALVCLWLLLTQTFRDAGEWLVAAAISVALVTVIVGLGYLIISKCSEPTPLQ